GRQCVYCAAAPARRSTPAWRLLAAERSTARRRAPRSQVAPVVLLLQLLDLLAGHAAGHAGQNGAPRRRDRFVAPFAGESGWPDRPGARPEDMPLPRLLLVLLS